MQNIQDSTEDVYKEPQPHKPPTPEDTSLPTSPRDRDTSGLPEITSYQRPISPSNSAPKASQILADLNPSNIVPQRVKRHLKPTNRKDAYATQLILAKQGSLQTYHNVFAAFSSNIHYLDTHLPLASSLSTL